MIAAVVHSVIVVVVAVVAVVVVIVVVAVVAIVGSCGVVAVVAVGATENNHIAGFAQLCLQPTANKNSNGSLF